PAQLTLIGEHSLLVETCEHHFAHAREVRELVPYSIDRNPRSRFERVAENARADGWKRDAAQSVRRGDRQGTAIGRGEQLWLAGVPALPHGTDGVDDESRGELEAGSDSRVSRRTRSNQRACAGELRPCRPMDCAAHAAAWRKTAVGGVDDGVSVQRSD